VALENAARAAYRLGRVEQAAGLYRRLAELDPGQAGPWKTLGALRLYELSDPAGARRAFERALAVESDPAERARLEELLAEIAAPPG
jgi:tetratricopeptide (TPR) repeat protein